ncbi:hypothetical protein [Streptomyces sp. NPDC002067]
MSDQTPPPSRLSVHERLALVYERLDAMPPATSADEAFDRLGEVLDQVEDQHSGVPKNPDAPLKFDGRMYHPRPDFVSRRDDGSVHAVTKGNEIHAAANGTLTITSRRTGEAVYHRDGAGPAPAAERQAGRAQDRTAEQSRIPRPSQAATDAANARSTGASKPTRATSPSPAPDHGSRRPNGPERGPSRGR